MRSIEQVAALRRPVVRMILIGAVASVIGVAITLALDWFPPQASTAAPAIDRLYDVLLIASVPIFVLVMTVAIYSVVRFRARPGDTSDGPPIHGNTRLEVLWVTVPFLIVTGLAIYAWMVLDQIERREPNALVVGVRGQQFAWGFTYPRAGGQPVSSTELVLPANRQVELRIDAVDVIHSFWVPAFRMKQDAVPGIQTRTRFTPTRVGGYDVVCAELCGLGHATMRKSARVVPPREFDAWLARRSKGPPAPAAARAGAAGRRPGAQAAAKGPGTRRAGGRISPESRRRESA